jgi:ribosomal protein S14
VTLQERPQDQVAQVRLLSHHIMQPRDRDAEHAARRADHCGQVRALPREHSHLARKLPRLIAADDGLPGLTRPLYDLNLAGRHHHQVVSLVPVGEQHVTHNGVLLGAVPAQDVQLRAPQQRSAARPVSARHDALTVRRACPAISALPSDVMTPRCRAGQGGRIARMSDISVSSG